jgi:hypothetical protein
MSQSLNDSFRGETRWVFRLLPNGSYRRILSVPACSGGGRLTQRTPAIQPRRREWVKLPPFWSFAFVMRCCR